MPLIWVETVWKCLMTEPEIQRHSMSFPTVLFHNSHRVQVEDRPKRTRTDRVAAIEQNIAQTLAAAVHTSHVTAVVPLVTCDAQTKGERNIATYGDGNHTPRAHVLVDASRSHATRHRIQAKSCELFSRAK